jgi:hypothetical protein
MWQVLKRGASFEKWLTRAVEKSMNRYSRVSKRKISAFKKYDQPARGCMPLK